MIWPTLAAALILISWLGFTAHRVQTPTTGLKIDRASRPNKALLVIDMQPVFLEGNGYNPVAVDKLVSAVINRIDTARSQGTVVIALQQEWRGAAAQLLMRLTAGGRGIPDRPGTQVLPDIAKISDQIIIKHIQDGFERPSLNECLAELAVGEIEIIGLDGLYCVRATAIGAANRGYNVTLNRSLILNSDTGKWERIMQSLEQAGVSLIG